MTETARMRQRAHHKEQGDKLSNSWRKKEYKPKENQGLTITDVMQEAEEKKHLPLAWKKSAQKRAAWEMSTLTACSPPRGVLFVVFFLSRRYKSRLCSQSSCRRWSPAKREIQKASRSSWNKALHLEPCMTEKLKSVCSKLWESLDRDGSVMAKICLSSDRLAVSKEVISHF